MGLMTLEDFRTELHEQFGARGVGNERMTLWINLGYFELCGKMEFEILQCQQYFATVDGSYVYELPDKFLGVVSIWDVTNKKRLRKKDTSDAGLLDVNSTNKSQPEWWMQRSNGFWLYPVPNGAYEIQIIYMKEPTKLINAIDTTILPQSWDLSVLLLAKHFGHLSFKELDQSTACYQRAMQQTIQNKTDAQWSEPTPKAGLTVAWSFEDLTDQDNE